MQTKPNQREISKEEFDEWSTSRVTIAVKELLELGISMSLERKAQKTGSVQEIGEHNIYQQGGIDTATVILGLDEEYLNSVLEQLDDDS